MANIERGIDTSGAAVHKYDGFTCVAIYAKDCGDATKNCGEPSGALIEGTRGYIKMDSAPNVCGAVKLSERRHREALRRVAPACLGGQVA